jgi:hypothetical protein
MPWTDDMRVLAAEMTASLRRNGYGGMLHADGLRDAPREAQGIPGHPIPEDMEPEEPSK